LHKKAGQDMKPDTKLMAAITAAINAYLQAEQSDLSRDPNRRSPVSGQAKTAPAAQ
jgi:hypothetical protein